MTRLLTLLLLGAMCPHDYKGEMCTEIGCQDGIYVTIERTAWPEGEYEFTFDVDGAETTCSATIPLSAGLEASCSSEMVDLILSGSELPVEEQSIPGAWIYSTQVSTLGIRVTLDGTQIGETSLTPEYETLEPNGPECDPICEYASTSFSL